MAYDALLKVSRNVTSWTRIDEDYLRSNLCCGYNDPLTPNEHPSHCVGWDADTDFELRVVDKLLDYLASRDGESLQQTTGTKPRYALSARSVRWMAEKGLPEWRGYVSKSGVLIQLLHRSRTLWWDTAEPLGFESLYVDIDRRIAHSPTHGNPCTTHQQPRCWP